MKKTVLIVEDNELNMKLFNDLLEAHGYATLKTATASRPWSSPAPTGRT
jgi:CheY-like chemotaxis protein